MSAQSKCSALNSLLQDLHAVHGNEGLPMNLDGFEMKFASQIKSLRELGEQDKLNSIKTRVYGDMLLKEQGMFNLCRNDLIPVLEELDSFWSKVNGINDFVNTKADVSPLDIQHECESKDDGIMECLEKTCAKENPNMIDTFNAMISLRSLRVYVEDMRKMLDKLTDEEGPLSTVLSKLGDELSEKQITKEWLATFDRWKTLVDERNLLERNFEDRRINEADTLRAAAQWEWVEKATARFLYDNRSEAPYDYYINHDYRHHSKTPVALTNLLQRMQFKDDDPEPAKVENGCVVLGSNEVSFLVDELLVSAQNLQGNLMAADCRCMRMDMIEIKAGLAKLKLWAETFAQSYTPKLPKPLSGRLLNHKFGIQLETWPSQPGEIICHGNTGFYVGTSANFRLETQWTSGTLPYFRHWGDTDFYSAESSWMVIPRATAEASKIIAGETEAGAFKKVSDSSHTYRANIWWKERLTYTPDAACWITRYDFECRKQILVEIKAYNANQNGLTIDIEVGDRTGIFLDSLRISYLVWSRGSRVFGKSSWCGANFGLQFSGTPPGVYYDFGAGLFREPPAIMLGISRINFDGNRNLRVEVRQEALTKDGVWVSAVSADDTINYGTAVTVIAVG
ncbi:hypothetical protein N7490_006142 [Penicillium lividum]|nr:hypothetical protein N7490_006142 [Penicillium lividum]